MATQNNKLCEEAKLYYYDHLCDESGGPVPQPVSNHIEQCRNCKKQINRLKEGLSQKESADSGQKKDRSAVTNMLKLHFAYIGEHVTCETVRPFLPALLDPDLEIKIPTPITVHLDNCPKCTKDLIEIQKLNLNGTQLYRLSRFFTEGPSRDTTEFSEMAAVSAMAERADSKVVTIFHIDKSAKARKAAKSGELYAGFPISVEIIHSDDKVKKPAPTVDFAAALKEKVSAMNLKSVLKITVAAAAVLLIGFTLLLNTPSAKAVTIEQIYKALEIVKNVHILKSVPDKTELITKITEEKWVSRTLNVSMSKTEKGFVMWDITNKVIKTRQLDANSSVETEMPEDLAAQMSRRINTSFGLMPFNDISEIPPDSQWLRVDDHPEAVEEIEIYDLKWTKRRYGGSSEFKIWRVFTDVKTSLPQKVEWYTRFDEDSVFVLETVMVVEYLDESAMLKVIEDTGF